MTPAVAPQVEQPLSQMERLVNVFTAPTKTFRDINRSASWWLPFIVICLSSLVFVYVVDMKIGLDRVAENQMRLNTKQMERMEQMPPQQRQAALAISEKITRAISWGMPVMALVMFVIMAAVLLGSFNFGQGTQIKFGQSLAVVMYANVVGVTKSVLTIVTLFAGADPDSFIVQNPVATNLGYFLDPMQNKVLYTLATAVDIVTIWTLVLVALGFTCISKVKKPAALAIVFGWWALLTLLQLAGAVMS